LGLARIGFHTVSSTLLVFAPDLTKSVFTPTYARFRELLIATREKRELTQAALAQRLNKPQSYVSKFERGERRLDVVEYLEVAEALRTDPFELLRELTRSSQRHKRS
jgi:ribosome-binding protein aMBF1 (putative translation factor)